MPFVEGDRVLFWSVEEQRGVPATVTRVMRSPEATVYGVSGDGPGDNRFMPERWLRPAVPDDPAGPAGPAEAG